MKNKVQACLTKDDIVDSLKNVGVNPTAQRIAICQFVLCQGDHPTADEIKTWVDQHFPKLSLATIYNTLKTLTDAGVLREYKFPHSGKSFYDNNLVDHYHLLDEESGKLIDIDSKSINVSKGFLKEFTVNKMDVIFYGKHKSQVDG
ncbi:MAG: Fur family transcriptional regulator [Planctomycetota bacterium]|nr:MAG: Fur family transcriptional regulator [Planctomycetota bacterium]